MLKMNYKQELGAVEGEDEKMQALIKKQANKPITFTQKNNDHYDADNMGSDPDEVDESFDFRREDEKKRRI